MAGVMCWSKALRRCAPLIAVLLCVSSARADYRYVTGDPVATHTRIIRDIQAGRLDPRNLDPGVLQGIYYGGPGSPRPDVLHFLGPLTDVCMSFAFRYPNGRKIVFRTVHSNGYGDWVVLVGENPEIVYGLTMFPLPRGAGTQGGGAPAILPPVPSPGPNGQGRGPPVGLPPVSGDPSIMLPERVDCSRADATPRPVPQQELQQVCRQWPLMCR